MRRHRRWAFAAGLVSSVLVFFCWSALVYDATTPFQQPSNNASRSAATSAALDFIGFDNETGRSLGGRMVVPNWIHYIRFNKTNFSFVDYVCLRSAYLHQKPERIFIHTNVAGDFRGDYWQRIKDERHLYSIITIVPIQLPDDIFGQRLSQQWQVFHGSDVARIRIMMKYGGIYLDNDVYVVNSLDWYRRFEIAMGWDDEQFLGSQVIIAHKDARFLPLWLETYRQYRPDLWYYNAGERPTTEILYPHPELLHRVKLRFGVHMLMRQLYDTKVANWPNWQQDHDTIHLLANHRSYLDPHFEQWPEFDEENIENYPFAFGTMARLVLRNRTG